MVLGVVEREKNYQYNDTWTPERSPARVPCSALKSVAPTFAPSPHDRHARYSTPRVNSPPKDDVPDWP